MSRVRPFPALRSTEVASNEPGHYRCCSCGLSAWAPSRAFRGGSVLSRIADQLIPVVRRRADGGEDAPAQLWRLAHGLEHRSVVLPDHAVARLCLRSFLSTQA